MSLFDEKRKLNDRRNRNDGPPLGIKQRRGESERRQTEIAEIPFSEWASHLVVFRKRAFAAMNKGR